MILGGPEKKKNILGKVKHKFTNSQCKVKYYLYGNGIEIKSFGINLIIKNNLLLLINYIQ